MTKTEDFSEERANLYQQIGELKMRVDRMEKPMSNEGLDAIALATAQRIEDLFVKDHGTRNRRLRSLQILLREVFRANLTGKTDWRYSEDLHIEPEPAAQE